MKLNKKLSSRILIILGLIIVFGTHGFMVGQFFNDGIGNLGISHAIINLIAGVLILIGYLLKR